MSDLAPPPPGEEPVTPCPGCGGTLSVEATLGRRVYVCPVCAGALAGVAVLRDLVGPELAQHLWTEAMGAAGTGDTGPCPFCARAMKAAAVENGRFWACKTCEMAWVDRPAFNALTKGGGPRIEVGTEESVPRCENCGAPLLHSWDQRCTYCQAAIAQRTTVTVEGDDGR